MPPLIDLQDYGRLTAEVAHLQREVTELRADMKKVLETLQQAAGGWRMMMLIGGASAVVGGLIVKILPYFFWTPK